MNPAGYSFSKAVLMIVSSVLVFTPPGIARSQEGDNPDDQCITHEAVIEEVQLEADKDEHKSAEFRITKADDGQSLLYWHFGGRTGSFHAVSFNAKGCAIHGASGIMRKFIFPKTAYNTGVFFEMEVVNTEF